MYSPVDLPNPGIEPVSPALSGRFFTTEPPGKPNNDIKLCKSGRSEDQGLLPHRGFENYAIGSVVQIIKLSIPGVGRGRAGRKLNLPG